MPSWRNKPKSEKGHYHKRRTYAQGKAEIDAAHRMTFRLYGDALAAVAPLRAAALQAAPALPRRIRGIASATPGRSCRRRCGVARNKSR